MADMPQDRDPAPSTGSAASDGRAPARISRRAVARAGLAAPVVGTLLSKHALAQGAAFNCTASGWLQIETSLTPSAMPGNLSAKCEGWSPGYWKANKAPWSTLPNYNGIALEYGDEGSGNKRGAGGTAFEQIFGEVRNDLQGNPLSLVQVMWAYPNEPVFHFIAGFLNAAKQGKALYGIGPDEVVLWYLGGYTVNGVPLTRNQGVEFFDRYAL